MRPLPIALAATLCTAFALPAAAQDVSADPNYATIDLVAGFPDDPFTVELQSGGDTEATGLASGCTGFIAEAPDVRLNYQSGSFPLFIAATADVDTTLVINLPDGSWLCDDDSFGDLDPLVSIASPMSGQYDIWVGTYGEAELHPAMLFISEVQPD